MLTICTHPTLSPCPRDLLLPCSLLALFQLQWYPTPGTTLQAPPLLHQALRTCCSLAATQDHLQDLGWLPPPWQGPPWQHSLSSVFLSHCHHEIYCVFCAFILFSVGLSLTCPPHGDKDYVSFTAVFSALTMLGMKSALGTCCRKKPPRVLVPHRLFLSSSMLPLWLPF